MILQPLSPTVSKANEHRNDQQPSHRAFDTDCNQSVKERSDRGSDSAARFVFSEEQGSPDDVLWGFHIGIVGYLRQIMSIDISHLEKQVANINKAVQDLRETGIREEVIFLLIQKSAGNVKFKPVPIKLVKAVVEGIESLEEYVFGDDQE